MAIGRESNGKADGEDRPFYYELRPGIEVWPGEGDFADWIAYHMAKDRPLICRMPEFRASPFCGAGHH